MKNCILLFGFFLIFLKQNPCIAQENPILCVRVICKNFCNSGFVPNTVKSMLQPVTTASSDRSILTIYNKSFIKMLQNQTKEISDKLEGTSEGSLDVKAVCLIYSRNGVDTLSFGIRNLLMIYNGKYYKLDTLLLKNLAFHLPEFERESIKQYLNDLQKHYKLKKNSALKTNRN